jgi:hypothetical protein
VNYWIFAATPKKAGGKTFSAADIYTIRMADKFWGIGDKTPNRKNIREGDRVVFYTGGLEPAFSGTATLASDLFDLSPDEQLLVSHETEYFKSKQGVRLDGIEKWDPPRPISHLKAKLGFIKNPNNWGAYFRGGIRQIAEADFLTIIGTPVTGPSGSVESETPAALSRFAIESHLEDFIEHNWSKIDWGAPLDLYQEGDQSGRQFPAGLWSIDFLATDKNTNDLIVIELKRHQASDAAVGQVLRYMGWVRKNIAKPEQKVRGIIVANDVDDALRHAVSELTNVSVRTYSVSFMLQVATP